jgi:hypothetical protein
VSENNPPETPESNPTPEPAASPASEAPRPSTGTTPRVGQLGDSEYQDYKPSVPLQSGERVLMVRHKHWMYLAPNTLLNFILALIPVVLLVKFLDLIDIDGGTPATLIYVIWFVIFLIRTAIDWYRYFNDSWVVTNQRIIDSRRKSPFDLQVSTADLVNVQNMTIRRHGIFQTLLNYGDVVCETAGMDNKDFTIGGVPNPSEVQALVDKERDRERMRGR